jgi:hypothetical protein
LGPGIRYYIITLATVFFALTFGLVVGSLFISPVVSARQTSAIVSLRETLNRDNVSLRQQVKRYQEFVSEATPTLLRDRLNNVPVAIVQTGDYPDTLVRVRDALQMAGAQILSVTTIERAFARPDELLNPALAALRARDPRFPTDRNGLAQSLATILARGEAATDGFIPALEKESFIDTESGSSYQTPARCVVLVAGSRTEISNRQSNVDQPLVQALQKQGLKVVACEPEDAAFSDIPAYRALNLDITTIDNVDSDLGRCALVFALSGDRGDYGVKSTASHLLPPLPKEN